MDMTLLQLTAHVAAHPSHGYRRPIHLIRVDKDGAWSSDGHRCLLVEHENDKPTSAWPMAENTEDVDEFHVCPAEASRVIDALNTWEGDDQKAGAGKRDEDGATTLFATTKAGESRAWTAHEPPEPIPFRDAMRSSVGAFWGVYNLKSLSDILNKMRTIADQLEHYDEEVDGPDGLDHYVTIRFVGSPPGKIADGSMSRHHGLRLHIAGPGAQAVILDVDHDHTEARKDRMSKDQFVPLTELEAGAMFSVPVDDKPSRFVLMAKAAGGQAGVRQAVALEDGAVKAIPDATLVAPLNIGVGANV